MLQETLELAVTFVNGLCFWHWLAAAYLALIVFERLQSGASQSTPYDTQDAICSLAIGITGTLVQFAFTLIIPLSIYGLAFDHWRIATIDNAAWALFIAFVIHDFVHYWVHRFGHRIGLLWSFHAVHHSSNAFNHTTAMRLFPSDGRLKLLAGVSAALIGISPEIYLAVALLKSGYSIWTHASYIHGLTWLEPIFVTPRLHRVHHANQAQYLDKNYGQVLIIWDRLFRTFQPYEQAPIPGLVNPVHDNNPITAQFVGIADLASKLETTSSWRNRLSYLIKPPEWSPSSLQTNASV